MTWTGFAEKKSGHLAFGFVTKKKKKRKSANWKYIYIEHKLNEKKSFVDFPKQKIKYISIQCELIV